MKIKAIKSLTKFGDGYIIEDGGMATAIDNMVNSDIFINKSLFGEIKNSDAYNNEDKERTLVVKSNTISHLVTDIRIINDLQYEVTIETLKKYKNDVQKLIDEDNLCIAARLVCDKVSDLKDSKLVINPTITTFDIVPKNVMPDSINTKITYYKE